MNNKEKMLLAIAVGFASGALMGALLVPAKGAKTKRVVRQLGKRIVLGLGEKIDEGKELMRSVKEAMCKEPVESEEK